MAKKEKFKRTRIQELRQSPDSLVEYLKRYDFIKNDKYWKMVCEELGYNDSTVVLQLMENSKVLKGLLLRAKLNAEKHNGLLQKISWETLIASFAVYLDILQEQAPSEQAFQYKRSSQIEMISRISQVKARIADSAYGGAKSIEVALKSIQRRLNKHNSVDCFEAFKDWDQVIEVEQVINNFCLKDWTVSDKDCLKILPSSQKKWEQWQLTHYKFELIHVFYSLLPAYELTDAAIEINETAPNDESRLQALSVLGGVLFVRDMVGVDHVCFDKADIDLHLTLHIMSKFDSCYKMKHKDNYEMSNRLFGNSGLRMITPSAVFYRSKSEMIKMMQEDEYYQAKQGIYESGVALEIFSDPPHSKALENVQFIKSGESGYFVLPQFYHGDVKTSLLNALIRKNEFNKTFSTNMENRIGELFEGRGYTVLLNWNYEAGEIDVLACKDNQLLVIEVKFTYFRTQTHAIYEHEEKIKKGEVQLAKALIAIRDNFPEIAEKLSIDVDHSCLMVTPLLVSLSPEFDGVLSSGIRKASLFELQTLLDPQRHIALEFSIKKYKEALFTETDSVFTKPSHAHSWEDDLDFIYKKADHIEEYEQIADSPQKLLDALEQGIVWQELNDHPAIVSGPQEQMMVTVQTAASSINFLI
ncbi:hypothetical protein [Maridesulfovibrio ferrireducens]|uniref:hypothetical protein n=1 Tax=Maridesulfovibrio ferrireducens TaxID=246191 RepID=UPI001A350E18|nr:hypothetical protein [Maridesulfovibrio ferrireducens]MBI9113058.1 hypothetical protein [Maridesulfovibrio ferrireducens]